MSIDLNKLLIFKTLVELKSYTETAKKFYVTQSAISQQIKSLQDDIGKPLLHKINNNLVLTSEGESFYNQVKAQLENILVSYDELKKNRLSKTCHIVGPYVFLQNILIPKMGFPKLNYQLNFLVGSSMQANDKLLTGQADIIFVSSPLSSRIVNAKEVFKEEMIFVANKKYHDKIIKGSPPSINIVDMDKDLRLLKRWKENNSISEMEYKTKTYATIPSIEGMKSFIMNHECAGIFPKHLILEELKIGRVMEVFKKCRNYTSTVYMCMLQKNKDVDVKKLYSFLGKLFLERSA